MKTTNIMKLVVIVLMLVVPGILLAQDSTRIVQPLKKDSAHLNATPKPAVISPARESALYKDEEQIFIRPDDLPLPVRQRLQDSNYKGWENGTIYQDRLSGDFSVEIKDGVTSKTFRFDKSGKVLTDPNKPKIKE